MNEGGTTYRKRRRSHDHGEAHYLTFSCYLRQPFFSGRLAAGWFLEIVNEARHEVGFELWAYVVMPEHAHLLIWPHQGVSIGTILRAVKRPLAQRVLSWVRENAPHFLPRMAQKRPSKRVVHRFWQAGGGYDRSLWTPQEIHEKLNYIHANPVRRNLVDRPEDWPWSSCRAWSERRDEPIPVDRESVPSLV